MSDETANTAIEATTYAEEEPAAFTPQVSLADPM